MELRALSNDEITFIYNTYMTVDFPPDELKPLSHIFRMLDGGIYSCYALYDGGRLLAYAYLVEVEDLVLIDYLAVLPDLRGRGTGSYLLALLKEKLAGKKILIECENVAFSKDAKERAVRERRIAFYTASGFVLTGVSSRLYGAEYVILCYPNISDAANALKTVYLEMLGKERFKKHFIVR